MAARRILLRSMSMFPGLAELLGIANVAIGFFFRDSEGDLVISGLGFQPKIVLFIAYGEGPGTETWSHGFDNGVSAMALFKYGNLEETFDTQEQSIAVYWDYITYITGHISSMNPDGFTITWYRSAAYANAKVIYLAMA